MYFKDFPKFLYDFKYDDSDETSTSIVLDITRNIRFRKEVLANIALYDEYDIVDGETPEIIAEKVYGNPNYHWIIMLTNERYDYLSDFPIQTSQMAKHCAEKYNPTLYSDAGMWYFKDGKLWFKVSNALDAFDPRYLTSTMNYTITGYTTDGKFTINETWGDGDDGVDYTTQQFWCRHTFTGTPVGQLKITTTGRENNPLYWVNDQGLKVTPLSAGSVSVSGVQEEERINESKRRIKIISPQVIGNILKQFKDFL